MFGPLFPLDNLSKYLITECPVCKSQKKHLEIDFLEDESDEYLTYVKCKKCFTRFVGIINIEPMGINTVGFATDLKKDEVIKFRQGERVNEDDILNLHQILENQKINFLKTLEN